MTTDTDLRIASFKTRFLKIALLREQLHRLTALKKIGSTDLLVQIFIGVS